MCVCSHDIFVALRIEPTGFFPTVAVSLVWTWEERQRLRQLAPILGHWTRQVRVCTSHSIRPPAAVVEGQVLHLGFRKKNIAQFDSVCRFGRSSSGLFGLGFRERTMTQLCLQELEHQGLSEYNQVLRDTGYDAACCKCCDLWRVALVERFGTR